MMATLANRDWYVADENGAPKLVRCLSQNYVLGTARVVDGQGNFGEIDGQALYHTAEQVIALGLVKHWPVCGQRTELNVDHDYCECPCHN